ncbi:MAG: OmpA family protein [Prevotella sp.]|nr:OmpA family protein [Prevotella sp.]
MKKFLLLGAVVALSAQSAFAQTVDEQKFWDGWYIGANVGINAPAKGSKVLKNINPEPSLRIGRWITPVAGFAVEGNVRMGDKPAETSKTFVTSTNVNLLGTVNFSNWFGRYPGEPRNFEVIGLAGMGWEHIFGSQYAPAGVGERNALTSKVGVDFAFNLGEKKAWQVYVEPNIVWGLNRHYNVNPANMHVRYDINDATIGLLLGVNYKFLNSNETHNFTIAQLRDQSEIDGLNAMINDLRNANSAKDNQLASNAATIADLRNQLEDCNKNIQVNTTTVVNNSLLQPTVIFRQGKSVIDPSQYAPIELIAKYMRNHPDCKILIKGYASPEGPADLNQRLSEARAEVVKQALIKRYKISADRLSTQGMGITDELFDEIEFNRVSTFTDTTK